MPIGLRGDLSSRCAKTRPLIIMACCRYSHPQFQSAINATDVMPTQRPSKVLSIFTWLAQVLLASSMAWAGAIKLFQPVDQTAAMWPWAGQVPVMFLKFTGVIDLTSAIGILLPAIFRARPKVTIVSAVGIFILMICAGIFHIARGEAAVIGVNVVFALLAAFVAWAYYRRDSVTPD